LGPEEFEVCPYCDETIIDGECMCPDEDEIEVHIEEELYG
jgi:hypothetical protein